MTGRLVILGASSRAAAFSALYAGLEPWCADCFADADLAARAVVRPARRWPDDLRSLAEEFPPGAWLYTGGVENYPALVDEIAARRPLYGNSGEPLRAARDPFRVKQLLDAAGLACPQCARSVERLDGHTVWLRKSRRSAGGAGVCRWPAELHGEREVCFQDDYFQQWIAGLPCSASYVAAGGRAAWLGLAEQIMRGCEGSAQFRWAGSLGPLPVSPAVSSQLVRLGEVLAAGLGLVGAFGVDGVLADEVFWPVEINPRYTASMELYERAGGRSIIADHVLACSTGTLPPPSSTSPSAWHGKQVLYAQRETQVNERLTGWAFARNVASAWPVVADIPPAGLIMAADQPLLTVFAEGKNREEAIAGLERMRLAVQARWAEGPLPHGRGS